MNIDPRCGLTEQNLVFLKGELLEARRELLELLRAPAELARESEPRGDAADQAEVSFQQALLGERAEANRRQLREIEDALERLEQGRYGLDETTGEPIGMERLSIEPWARHTIVGQEERERAPGSP
jgi:DnaK suppressor protein